MSETNGGAVGGDLFERGEIVFFAFLRPLAAAFLHDPKADDVFEQAHGIAETDFVREAERRGPVR